MHDIVGGDVNGAEIGGVAGAIGDCSTQPVSGGAPQPAGSGLSPDAALSLQTGRSCQQKQAGNQAKVCGASEFHFHTGGFHTSVH